MSDYSPDNVRPAPMQGGAVLASPTVGVEGAASILVKPGTAPTQLASASADGSVRTVDLYNRGPGQLSVGPVADTISFTNGRRLPALERIAVRTAAPIFAVSLPPATRLTSSPEANALLRPVNSNVVDVVVTEG